MPMARISALKPSRDVITPINLIQDCAMLTHWRLSTVEVPEELGFQADTIVKAITDLPALLRG
jgi:hypothetical protein